MKPFDIQRLISFFTQKEGATSLEETHVSQVLLTPTHAYKIPKTVALPYLDFSSLEQRKVYCQEEIRLNRRLTDGIYLEVVEIRDLEGQIAVGEGEGTILDYAIKMKRLPDERLMSNLLLNKQVQARDMVAIADQLVSFQGIDRYSIRDKAIFELIFSSGLRVSEVVSLNINHIDDTRELRITGKGNKERLVPVGTDALKYLKI